MSNWRYYGDVNPEHGEVWINIDEKRWGYADAVRVDDIGHGMKLRPCETRSLLVGDCSNRPGRPDADP